MEKNPERKAKLYDAIASNNGEFATYALLYDTPLESIGYIGKTSSAELPWIYRDKAPLGLRRRATSALNTGGHSRTTVLKMKAKEQSWNIDKPLPETYLCKMIPYAWNKEESLILDLESSIQPHIANKYSVMRTTGNIYDNMKSNILFEGRKMTSAELEELSSYLLLDALRSQFRLSIYAHGTKPKDIKIKNFVKAALMKGVGTKNDRRTEQNQRLNQLRKKSKEK
uniref:Uncharacterized protein n=1 Tax=Ditylenchus dipsaci TaxID=166011 RepID=A0A915EPR5_9BILA